MLTELRALQRKYGRVFRRGSDVDGKDAGRRRTRSGTSRTRTQQAASLAVETPANLRWRALRDELRPKYNYQTVMYLFGLVLLASAVLHLGVFLGDGGSWWGPVSWRKPITFGFSLGISAMSLAWIQGLLPPNRFLGWTATILAGVFSVVEAGLITMQTWRGEPSHFNSSTAFDGTVFILMAAAVGLLTLGTIVVGIWAAVRLRQRSSALIAVLVGIVLLLVGSAIGGDLIGRGNAVFEATGAVPPGLLIGIAGSGKFAHAAAIHGMQALGALELLFVAFGVAGQLRTRLMTLAASGYVVGTGLVALQAYGGRSMLELSPLMAAGMLICFGLIGVAYAGAFLSPKRIQRATEATSVA